MTDADKAAQMPHELELYNAVNLVREGFVLRDRISDDEAQPYFSAIEYVIQAALTTPAANTGDIVKPLDWQERNNGNRYCVTAVGAYEIGKDGFVYFPYICKYPSYEEGMAALLKDYTTKVSSLLAEPALAPRQDDEFLRKLIDVVQCDWGRGFPGRREQDAYIAKAKDVFAGKIKLENNDEEAPRQVDVEKQQLWDMVTVQDTKEHEAAFMVNWLRGSIKIPQDVRSRIYWQEAEKCGQRGLIGNAPGRTETPALWVRDVDGTGSLHPCLKGDPGAIPLYR